MVLLQGDSTHQLSLSYHWGCGKEDNNCVKSITWNFGVVRRHQQSLSLGIGKLIFKRNKLGSPKRTVANEFYIDVIFPLTITHFKARGTGKMPLGLQIKHIRVPYSVHCVSYFSFVCFAVGTCTSTPWACAVVCCSNEQ